MGDPTEELEPLFDYRRVQPHNSINLEDDSDSSPPNSPKRRKLSNNACGKTKVGVSDHNGKSVEIVDCDDKEEEDWLPPPPKISEPISKLEEDSTIRELRIKKQELVSLTKSAEDAIRAVEEAARRAATTFTDSSFPQKVEVEPVKPPSDRAKIVISVQDQTGTKQYRVFADEKFELLFKKYAEKAKVDLKKLVFTFDGDKIDPSSTPQRLELEDDDLIEVHVKAR